MRFDQEQKKHFRRIGHQLKPVLTIGDNGVGETHLVELERALEDHELIKVKINLAIPEDRQQMLADLCATSGATSVQLVGKVALLYRAAKKPNPKLSNLLRHSGF
ncbi:Predicted RNA-binding protein containing KH domain, possibly ribosomal protein [gamma proteobacterium HdN1]|nr:Predicted RNA-binding protein containing KH domain, possibly ribosomal protein [gamma proteobacterium HdN1]